VSHGLTVNAIQHVMGTNSRRPRSTSTRTRRRTTTTRSGECWRRLQTIC
jgi:hypothetical protein